MHRLRAHTRPTILIRAITFAQVFRIPRIRVREEFSLGLRTQSRLLCSRDDLGSFVLLLIPGGESHVTTYQRIYIYIYIYSLQLCESYAVIMWWKRKLICSVETRFFIFISRCSRRCSLNIYLGRKCENDATKKTSLLRHKDWILL